MARHVHKHGTCLIVVIVFSLLLALFRFLYSTFQRLGGGELQGVCGPWDSGAS